jgi:hypothetical protein
LLAKNPNSEFLELFIKYFSDINWISPPSPKYYDSSYGKIVYTPSPQIPDTATINLTREGFHGVALLQYLRFVNRNKAEATKYFLQVNPNARLFPPTVEQQRHSWGKPEKVQNNYPGLYIGTLPQLKN